jgi:excisionase family DNA binding protein
MSIMSKQRVLIGEIVLDGEPVSLRVEAAEQVSRARSAILKYKLAFLLDSRFRPAPPEPSNEKTIDEVTALWGCHRVTVLRRLESGELHPIDQGGDVRFDRAEVERLNQ